MTRRLYIDWLRGLAVLLMILWHSVDAWTVEAGRDSLAFSAIIFAAGWVAPLFLFLAGVSLPLAAASKVGHGLNRRQAAWALQKRGWQVFALAHLFRFQSFLLNPNGSWNAILKPDILNVLGLGIVAVAWCWGRAPRSLWGRVAWFVIPAVFVVAVLTPWARLWWWPTLLHPRLEAYIRPVGNFGVFSLFPAVAYVFAGTFLGALIADRDGRDAAFFKRIGAVGALLLAVGVAVSVAVWSSTPRWMDVAWVFVWRSGAMALAVAASWWMFRYRQPTAWSPLVLLGQTSLFVYWVHVELAYGVFSYPLHHALALRWSLAAYLLLTLLMLACAAWWNRRSRGAPLIARHLAAA